MLNHLELHEMRLPYEAEGIKGFTGGLSAKNYIKIADTTASTATRDLQKLVEMDALFKKGELKASRYFLNIPTVKQLK